MGKKIQGWEKDSSGRAKKSAFCKCQESLSCFDKELKALQLILYKMVRTKKEDTEAFKKIGDSYVALMILDMETNPPIGTASLDNGLSLREFIEYRVRQAQKL